jgi:hypothetical protein
MTLRELITTHPEWADLHLTWGDPRNGSIEFLGASAHAFEGKWCDKHLNEHSEPNCDLDTCPDSYKVVVLEGN